VVYRFDPVQQWQKLGIEGSMFVVRRSALPLYRCIVLNRSGINNYEQDLAADTQLEMNEPYLICRGAGAPDIFGLWCARPPCLVRSVVLR
jgi:mRNA-decapping enzyme 1B